jgi:hypothetical protein
MMQVAAAEAQEQLVVQVHLQVEVLVEMVVMV